MKHRGTRGARWTGVSLLLLIGASVALVAFNTRTGPAPLAGTFGSPEALGVAVVEAMRAGDIERLQAMALTEDEFRGHVWPDLPAARPERNVPFEFVWGTLHQNSEGYLRQTASGLAGRSVAALRDVRFAGESSRYGDVIVHRDTQLVFTSPDGSEKIVELFGSTIEQDGRFKVFSYVVD